MDDGDNDVAVIVMAMILFVDIVVLPRMAIEAFGAVEQLLTPQEKAQEKAMGSHRNHSNTVAR